jgi:hypothetical protein
MTAEIKSFREDITAISRPSLLNKMLTSEQESLDRGFIELGYAEASKVKADGK